MDRNRSSLISIIALFISGVSLGYTILSQELGILIGRESYRVSTFNKLDIGNNILGLWIRTNLTIHNNGTIPLRLDKVSALIKLRNNHHVFVSRVTENIAPQSVWNGDVILSEKLSDEDRKIRDDLGIDILQDLLVQYHDDKSEKSKIFLSKELYQRAETILKANTDWLAPDDNYFFLLLLWFNNVSEEPSQKKLYQFKIKSDQVKILRDYQLESYKTPRQDIFGNNISIEYTLRPDIMEKMD